MTDIVIGDQTETRAVCKRCQPVVIRQMLATRFGHLGCGYIPADPAIAFEGALFIENRTADDAKLK